MFDSGVGGLTVLKAFLDRNPGMPFVYLGDTAHCPYGDRPLDEVRELAMNAIQTLVRRDCDRIVFACNISSSVALDAAQNRFPDHSMHGLLTEALAREVRLRSSSGRVGVLATTGTVRSGRYRTILEGEGLSVRQKACPQLVPLIEAGRTSGPIVRQTLDPLLEPLLEFGADTFVLGCTHYPLISDSIRELIPEHVSLVDPGRVLADSVPLRNNGTSSPSRDLLVTGSSGSLQTFLNRDSTLRVDWLDSIEPNSEPA
jgi:glutamate racemase